MGMQYSATIRAKVFKHTRTSPLPTSSSAFSGELGSIEQVWLTRSEDSITASTRSWSVKGTYAAPQGRAAVQGSVQRDVCLWQASNKCTQKSCKCSEVCPFCNGKLCQNREGYLEWHLQQVKTPREIIIKEPASAGGSRGGVRSRSPYRGRGSAKGGPPYSPRRDRRR